MILVIADVEDSEMLLEVNLEKIRRTLGVTLERY